MENKCPHKGGPLVEGFVYDQKVTCPLHAQTFELKSGKATFPDKGCVQIFNLQVKDDSIYVDLSEFRQNFDD